MAEPLTLKVEFEGDLRRFRLRLEDEDAPASKIRAIHEAICKGFTLGEDLPPLILKYKDEEGDACTLVEATIEDFLAQPGVKPLRLSASRPSQSASKGTIAPTVSQVSPPSAALPAASASSPPLPAVRRDAEAAVPVRHPAASSSARNPADGCHSVGPWKLLMCLRSLHDADMMSSKMVSSMLLQFLPILAQRAHRKQEKLNKLGPQMREALLPLLHSVSAHLDLVEDARGLRPLLEEFITGSDSSRLGDFVAALFKALSTCKDRHAVAEAITAVAPELLESLPQLIPDLFAGSFTDGAGPPEHTGIRCSACNREPCIKGPRFHCAEAQIDLCGECFIDQGCEVTDQQFQCFFVPSDAQGAPTSSRDTASFSTGSWREHMKGWPESNDWKESWRKWKEEKAEFKAEWKRDMARRKGEFMKGKAKGKGKGKGKWHWWVPDGATDAAEDGANSTISDSMASAPAASISDAGDTAPPGLDLPHACWGGGGPWWWKGKGRGKGKDWAPMQWPWGPWEGSMMNPAFSPHFWNWGCDAWPSDGHWGQFENPGFESMTASVCSEGRQEVDTVGKVEHEQIEGHHPN